MAFRVVESLRDLEVDDLVVGSSGVTTNVIRGNQAPGFSSLSVVGINQGNQAGSTGLTAFGQSVESSTPALVVLGSNTSDSTTIPPCVNIIR